MAIYIILAIMLWLIALAEVIQKSKIIHWPSYVALFLFIIFAGTRFETGYDWIAYQETFEDAPSLYDVLIYQQSILNFTPMESFYALFNVVVKSFWDDVQALFFLITLFNGIVIFRFLRRFGGQPAFGLAFYFCFAYLTGQMTLVRQSLASSFIFLAIIFYVDHKRYKSIILGLCACGFHVSAIMFYPILLVLRFKPNGGFITGSIVIGFIIYFFSESIVGISLETIKLISFGFMDDKINEYISMGDYSRSLGSLIYIFINIGFVLLSMIVGKKKNWGVTERLLLYFCLMMVLSQLFFGSLPVIWNRVQLVVVVVQACVLINYLQFFNDKSIILLTFFSAILSVTVLSYYLQRPRMEPFIPYQSTLEHFFYDHVSDGRFRLENAIKDSVSTDLLE